MSKKYNISFWAKKKMSKKDKLFVEKYIKILKFSKEGKKNKYAVATKGKGIKDWTIVQVYDNLKDARDHHDLLFLGTAQSYKSKLVSNKVKKEQAKNGKK